MPLTDFLRQIRPEGNFGVWAQLLADHGRSISRQALEHYCAGRRIPEVDIFRDMLKAAGRNPEDEEGWRAWCVASGIPYPAVLQTGTTNADSVAA